MPTVLKTIESNGRVIENDLRKIWKETYLCNNNNNNNNNNNIEADIGVKRTEIRRYLRKTK
jgi:hypothetical protein